MVTASATAGCRAAAADRNDRPAIAQCGPASRRAAARHKQALAPDQHRLHCSPADLVPPARQVTVPPGLSATIRQRRWPVSGSVNSSARRPCCCAHSLPLSHDDVRRLADEARQNSTLVLLRAYCGLRWGELVALRVADVDFLRRRIHVHTNPVQLGAQFAVWETKGHEARWVPDPQFVVDWLARHCESRERDHLVFSGPAGNNLPRPKSKGGWIA